MDGGLMSLKLHFPVDDVVKNVRHFMTSVKRVTGNQRDKEDKKTAKPGKYFTHPTLQIYLSLLSLLVTSISKVMLSSGQGPGIQISDF